MIWVQTRYTPIKKKYTHLIPFQLPPTPTHTPIIVVSALPPEDQSSGKLPHCAAGVSPVCAGIPRPRAGFPAGSRTVSSSSVRRRFTSRGKRFSGLWRRNFGRHSWFPGEAAAGGFPVFRSGLPLRIRGFSAAKTGFRWRSLVSCSVFPWPFLNYRHIICLDVFHGPF